jgi:hypothetical protein
MAVAKTLELITIQQQLQGWEETSPSNIRKHQYKDIRNNAISVVPRGEKQMSLQKIRMLVRLFSTHCNYSRKKFYSKCPLSNKHLGFISGGQWVTQDDLALPRMTSTPHGAVGGLLRRRGSCESGFFSVGTCDWLLDSSALSSTRCRCHKTFFSLFVVVLERLLLESFEG